MAALNALEKYNEQQNSEIEWLGDIPAHWQLKRLKYVVEIVKRIAGKEGFDVLSITQKGIKVKDVDSGEGQLAQDYSNYQLLYKGEFAMNHMDLLTGYVDISKYDGVTSPDYRVFRNRSPDVLDAYLLLIFQVGYRQRIFYKYGQGVSFLGRWRFPADNFNNFFVPIPSLEEQKNIVEFLSQKTAYIDEAIFINEKQITLLRERKKSIIQNFVTLGIEQNAPMKDSGVDWIGKVPEHWDIRRAKYIFKKLKREIREEDGVITCFRDGQVTLRTNRRTEGFTFAIKEHGYQGVRKGDLVIHAMDAFAGAIGVSDADGKSSPVYSVCIAHSHVSVNPKYYALYLRNLAVSGFIESLAKGIRERSTDFRFKDFAELFLPIPDKKTQNDIVNRIETEHKEVDSGIELLSVRIESLKEYKATLINSAVTGSIKLA